MYVYLTKLPVLGCASGTRLSYLTSLKEVMRSAPRFFQDSPMLFYAGCASVNCSVRVVSRGVTGISYLEVSVDFSTHHAELKQSCFQRKNWPNLNETISGGKWTKFEASFISFSFKINSRKIICNVIRPFWNLLQNIMFELRKEKKLAIA